VVQRNRRATQMSAGEPVEVNVTKEPGTKPSQDPSQRKP
jgi:hypothetical protein